jgi:hypothetical protein
VKKHAVGSNSEFKNNHGQTQTNTDKSKDLEPKVRHNPLQRIMLFPYGPWLKSEFLAVWLSSLKIQAENLIFNTGDLIK